ncbi:Putative uncharacterized protein [Lacticaseibacillus paracasei]|nr:Putative uncharacterized protein [Lacticaseibacillus paracasei]
MGEFVFLKLPDPDGSNQIVAEKYRFGNDD